MMSKTDHKQLPRWGCWTIWHTNFAIEDFVPKGWPCLCRCDCGRFKIIAPLELPKLGSTCPHKSSKRRQKVDKGESHGGRKHR